MSIRFLKPGERVPTGKPRRYHTEHGYIRLRWRIGPRQYVETYEHRVVGDRVTRAEHVHHKNHVRDDNRPENLAYISAAEHVDLHSSGIDTDELVRRYEAGASTLDLARAFGTHAGNVSRMLRAAGVRMRSKKDYAPQVSKDHLLDLLGGGLRGVRLARHLRISEKRLGALLDEYGIPRLPPGRPRRRTAA